MTSLYEDSSKIYCSCLWMLFLLLLISHSNVALFRLPSLYSHPISVAVCSQLIVVMHIHANNITSFFIVHTIQSTTSLRIQATFFFFCSSFSSYPIHHGPNSFSLEKPPERLCNTNQYAARRVFQSPELVAEIIHCLAEDVTKGVKEKDKVSI